MAQAPTTIFLMADTLNTRAIVAAATAALIRALFQWLMLKSPARLSPFGTPRTSAHFPALPARQILDGGGARRWRRYFGAEYR
jgi:hypothetical protein